MKAILKSLASEIVYFFKINLRYISYVLILVLPYAMYFLGLNDVKTGIELVIPICCLILSYCIKEAADRSNVGNRIPTPKERFSKVDEFGEVQIENSRLEELILYVADLEDWLERKGLI